ncbi:MAG: chromosome segregation protein SMC [Candidatus Thorarchaeota archaeon]
MVYIEKIVCRGFKSFGRDPVTIRLKPGFTCIVGPNGSGKSNVVDAILFVLGQLSAKTLRANVFSDLLYSPPKPNMPPKAKSATVEIHFDNRDRRLPIDTDRVVIERELDDTGKSVCRINGRTVTRIQVLDILGNIGVDPNGYNLVLQGETAQMVKMSPVERRKLIEEIAGISAYDEQKERALKKLSESDANLSRVDAHIQERRRILEKLEHDRADAQRYQDTRNQIQSIKVDILSWFIIKGEARLSAIDESLSERSQEAERIVHDIEALDRKIAETEREIEAIDAEMDGMTGGEVTRVSEQFGLLSAEVRHLDEEKRRLEAQYESTLGQRKALTDELHAVEHESQRTAEEIEQKKIELGNLDVEISKCDGEISRLEAALQREQDSYYELQRRMLDLNNELRSLDESISDVRSTIKSEQRELKYASEELQDAENVVRSAEAEIQDLMRLLPERRSQLAEDEALESSKREELEQLVKKLELVDSQVTESSRLVDSTREELIRIQARNDALREAEEAFLRREKAVARVLEMRNGGELPGIYGTVSELGTIDPEYAVAMEIAGGTRLSYIVVDNEDTAEQCIKILKRERVGRASFIPLNRIRSKISGNIPDDDRVIGYALDLVSFDEKMRPAFEFVFADTLVTEDFETAKRVGMKGWRAVSLEGDLVEKSGLITGGHYHRGKTGLSLQVEDKSPEVIERLSGLEHILSDLKEKQKSLRDSMRVVQQELDEISKRNYKARLSLEGEEERLRDRIGRRDSFSEKIQQLKTKIQTLESHIEKLLLREQELVAQREMTSLERDRVNEALTGSVAIKINQELKDLREVASHQKRRRDQLANTMTSLRASLQERIGPRANELKLRIESSDTVLASLENDLKVLKAKLDERSSILEGLRAEKERVEEIIKDRRLKQMQLRETLKSLRFDHEELREAQTGNERSVYRLQTERARLESDIVGWNAELASLSDAAAEIAQRRSAEEPSYKDLETLEAKIKELERELDAMGAVNLKALTDYDAERNLYDELVDKKAKLEEERKEILSFMDELEREKTRKFLEVYNEIADNFKKVFAKLSPGGEATLMLENPEHPLMGGVTVHSKPRGKELVTLESMSGGEKALLGLALIFAIQMYSPASFYVFDEIDAALDDVNAHNVAQLISEMSKSSQFIVISLRDVTARKADLLVGVSNQDGISRIVPVDLEEVAGTT